MPTMTSNEVEGLRQRITTAVSGGGSSFAVPWAWSETCRILSSYLDRKVDWAPKGLGTLALEFERLTPEEWSLLWPMLNGLEQAITVEQAVAVGLRNTVFSPEPKPQVLGPTMWDLINAED